MLIAALEAIWRPLGFRAIVVLREPDLHKNRTLPLFWLTDHILEPYLISISRSYADMEREVSQILGFRWHALNDKQFKLTPLPLTNPYYYEGFEEA